MRTQSTEGHAALSKELRRIRAQEAKLRREKVRLLREELVSLRERVRAVERELRRLGEHEPVSSAGRIRWTDVFEELGDTFTARQMAELTGAPPSHVGYGYQWWTRTIEGHEVWNASGHAGLRQRRIFVGCPEPAPPGGWLAGGRENVASNSQLQSYSGPIAAGECMLAMRRNTQCLSGDSASGAAQVRRHAMFCVCLQIVRNRNTFPRPVRPATVTPCARCVLPPSLPRAWSRPPPARRRHSSRSSPAWAKRSACESFRMSVGLGS